MGGGEDVLVGDEYGAAVGNVVALQQRRDPRPPALFRRPPTDDADLVSDRSLTARSLLRQPPFGVLGRVITRYYLGPNFLWSETSYKLESFGIHETIYLQLKKLQAWINLIPSHLNEKLLLKKYVCS